MKDRIDLEAIFDRLTLETLRSVTAGLVMVFGVFLIFNLLDLPPQVVVPVAISDLILIVIFATLNRAIRRQVISSRWAHPLGFTIALLVTSNILLTMALLAEPFYTIYVMVVLVGAGGLFLSRRWIGLTLSCVVIAWIAVGSRVLAGPELLQYAFSLVAASALSCMFYAARSTTLGRLEYLQRRNESKTLELEHEMASRIQVEQELRLLIIQKEVLMKETHHRVKNNLQVVSSLISLQARRVEDDFARATLRESQARVRSMALVHEKLCQSDDLAHVDLIEYARSLTRSLESIYRDQLGNVDIAIHGDRIPNLDLQQAVPWGLLLQELVTNSLKHAFEGRESGSIQIELHRADKEIHLSVSDDGVGMPNEIDHQQGGSLGMELIRSLTDQLGGQLVIHRDEGTRFLITVPDSKISQDQTENDDSADRAPRSASPIG